jgi:hypothetical protein
MAEYNGRTAVLLALASAIGADREARQIRALKESVHALGPRTAFVRAVYQPI